MIFGIKPGGKNPGLTREITFIEYIIRIPAKWKRGALPNHFQQAQLPERGALV